MARQKLGQSLTLLLGVSLLLGGCGSEQREGADTRIQSGGKVTILGTLIGVGEDKLKKAIAPFTAETGIEVVYEGTDAFTTLVPVRVDSGNTPDIALFPQPGLMADFAREGKMIPLDTFMDRSQLLDAYSEYWLDLVSIEENLYGIWIRASVKSLVWYSPPAFSAAGYSIPTTWVELQALSNQIVADGGVPWCLGMESGKATGWVGTDWIEDILLRMAGPEVYDQWVRHDIGFTNPAVKAAFEEFGEIVFNPDYVLGGTTSVISSPFNDSPRPLFNDPPGCYLHRQANFITAFFPENVELGKDVSLFPLPPIDPAQGSPLLVGGIVFGMMNDTPEARALMAYLATPQPHEIWAGLGSYISPHRQVSLAAYPDEITQRQAEILANADVIRFDGSDLMPGAVGTGAFWSGMVDYVGGQDLDAVLANIEASWPN